MAVISSNSRGSLALDHTFKFGDHQTSWSLLRSGYVPTKQEASSIFDQIQQLESDISLVDSKINQLQAVRNELRKKIDCQRGLLSSIRRLPDDVLEEIFFLCKGSDGIIRTGHHGSFKFVQRLTAVCRRWRATALSMHNLWSSFSVDCATVFGKEPLLHSKRQVEACLDRSGDAPLNLIIRACQKGSLHDALLAEILVSCSTRWSTVSLCVDFPSFTPYMSIIEGQLPNLRAVAFQSCCTSLNAPMHVLLGAPHLSQLTFAGVPSLSDIAMDDLPLQQIKRFRWTRHTFNASPERESGKMAYQVIQKLPLLQELELDVTALVHDPNQTSFILPYLESLDIKGSAEDMVKFFQATSLPNLRKLRIQMLNRFVTGELVDTPFMQPLVQIMSGMKSPLLSLALVGASEKWTIQLLKATPTARHVRVCPGGTNSGLLSKELAQQFGGVPSILPNLHSFHVTKFAFSDNAIRNIIKTRALAVSSNKLLDEGPRLRYLNVIYSPKKPLDSKLDLETFASMHGVVLCVSTHET
ncbi:hypothetical protein BDQ17DRAFT_1342053 [Cyathus striatus]|nr:hypothetical protein BDQ17DRAFT_1342053 [Cyathus striatus]